MQCPMGNGTTYKNKKKFLIYPLFADVLQIYNQTALDFFQRRLIIACIKMLFVQFVCSAQHAELCAAVQLMADFLLFLALNRVYELLGENIILF